MEIEFNKRLADIRLRQTEHYDCTTDNVLAFRKKSDRWNGIQIALGNMCNGFPFEIGGICFHNSECAYIAGAYSGNDPHMMEIQRLVIEERNGLKAKRKFRNPPYNNHLRSDWNSFNVQWMLYLVWQKSVKNEASGSLLKTIPIDAIVVENSSFQNGPAKDFWGATNQVLKNLRKAEGKKSVTCVYDKGTYTGFNVMGKIIKLCSLCLIFGEEAPVDYELLNDKRIFLNGKLMSFPEVRHDEVKLSFIMNARNNN